MTFLTTTKEASMYNLTQERKNYPRVNDIIEIYTDRSLRSIPIDTFVNTMIRDECIRKACINHMQGISNGPVDKDVSPYFESFVKWYHEEVDDLISLGTLMFDDENEFCCHYDGVVKLKNDKHVLIAIRVSQEAACTWDVQLAAYKQICDLYDIKVDGCCNIILRPNNTRTLRFVKNLESAWDAFKAALTCYHFFNHKEPHHVA